MRFSPRFLVLFALATPALAHASGLGGSPESMVHQHAIAVKEDYSFLRTSADVRKQQEAGRLVPVVSGADFTLSNVSFPATRPEVLSFIEHFAAEYHAATGTRLVITSLTRPTTLQPANAHRLSVHPAGMAVDFRVPADATSRAWLEKTLLAMEQDGVIDVTREKSPAHYHIAVFAEPFLAYVAKLDAAADSVREDARRAAVARALSVASVSDVDASESNGAPALLAGLSLLAVALPVTLRVRRRHTLQS
jgi:hypothetical protein